MELTLVPAVEIEYQHTDWILPKPINQRRFKMAKKYVYETVIDVLSETRQVLSCPLDYKYDYLCKDKNDTYKHVGIKVINSGVELYFDDRFGLTIQADSVLSDPKHLRTLIYMMSTMP